MTAECDYHADLPVKIEELPDEPEVPELVTSEARPVGGMDLLGLRAPAESFAQRQLDGVTTVTPTIRYLSLRCWLIHRYIELRGPRDPRIFGSFAAAAQQRAQGVGSPLILASPQAGRK